MHRITLSGRERGKVEQFLSVPVGAETCGPVIHDKDQSVFVAVQHPGEDADSTFDQPSTRWPDFSPKMPPRPSVVAITRDDGGVIGS